MTQPPYVPPRDDDNSTPGSTWPPATEPSVTDEKDSELFASQFPASSSDPVYTEATYTEETYVEPVSSVYVSGDYSTDDTSTKDVAKDQAAEVKDTAVAQGQQVAGVAKEQATAVKDTAVEQGQQVAGVAKEQATAVKDTAVEQGQQVAEVAKEQVSKVASEASTQAKDLLAEGIAEVRSQAGSQQKRLASGIHSLAGELGEMASKSEQSGPLTDYAKQLSAKGGEAAHWLENAEPSEVLDSLRSFARRRPAVFLAASALAGVVVGRLTRGLVANAKDESEPATLSNYSAVPAYEVEAAPRRESISLEEIPTSGSGYGYTTDAPDYGTNEATLPYGGTGSGGVTR